MKNFIQVSYRDISKMLVKAMPLQDDDFGNKVEEYIKVIRAMPKDSKLALKSAYIFSHKVPREEREDLFQDIALAILKAKATDERLAYTIARCDWLNWWKKFKNRQHYSLDSVVSDEEGNQIPYGELLIGEVEYEAKLNGDLDGESLYQRLPKWVQVLVNKRLQGYPIRGWDRVALNKWVVSRPLILASYQT